MNLKLIIIIIFILFGFFQKRYFLLLPTIPIYPNNKNEVLKVKNYINNRNQMEIDFFFLTNQSVVYAFKPYVKESIDFLKKKTHECDKIILFLKYLFNRARPNQIDKSITPLDISTAKTPAFPAGHAFQAYYLETYLSTIYPEKKELFLDIAKQCDLARVKAGLHYPSDGKFSKQFVDFFFNNNQKD